MKSPIDIRIDTDFPGHWKTRMLRRRCRGDGVDCLVSLWCYAANHRPSGDLSGMTADQIAGAAGWGRDPLLFEKALIDCRFVDGVPGRLQLHDWAEHQPFVVTREKRSADGRAAAQARWHQCDGVAPAAAHTAACAPAPARAGQPRDIPTELDAGRMRVACEGHAGGNAPDPSLTRPDPDRSPRAPLPPAGGTAAKAPRDEPKKAHPQKASPEVQQAFDHWREVMCHADASLAGKLGAKRAAAIADALQTYPIAAIIEAIDGCARTPHNMGDNDQHERYDSIELILRDAQHIDRFRRNAANPPRPAGAANGTPPWEHALRLASLPRDTNYDEVAKRLAALPATVAEGLRRINSDPVHAVEFLRNDPEKLPSYKRLFDGGRG